MEQVRKFMTLGTLHILVGYLKLTYNFILILFNLLFGKSVIFVCAKTKAELKLSQLKEFFF